MTQKHKAELNYQVIDNSDTVWQADQVKFSTNNYGQRSLQGMKNDWSKHFLRSYHLCDIYWTGIVLKSLVHLHI